MEINKDIFLSGTNVKLSDLQNPDDYYSTEEFKTNKIWTDGKPVYRRVMYKVVNNNGEATIDCPSGYKECVSFDAYLIYSSGEQIPLPRIEISYSSGNSYSSITLLNTSSWIKRNCFYIVGAPVGSQVKIILEYTKN
jgi:hypothetical protein